MINLDSSMPILELPTTGLAAAPSAGANAQGSAADAARLKKVANDFESVFLHKLMEEMQKTVPESGLLEDTGSEQVRSMFWFNLAQDISQRGGLGLGQELYRQMQSSQAQAPAATTSERL